MRAWIAAIILLSSVVHAVHAVHAAPPPKLAPLTPAARAQYSAALAKARKLQGAKKYDDATAAFNEALAAAPGDATTLGELGWTAYLAKDYKTAEAMTRKALAAQGAPRIRGATLYNLGLIQEHNGDKTGAIVSYTLSLVARPNSVVRAALAKLDTKAASAAAPLTLNALTGYATIDAYCKAAPKTDDPENCTCGDALDGAPAMPISKPFDEIKAITEHCGHDGGNTNYDIAVRLGKKWYVEYLDASDLSMGCDGDLKINSVTTHGALLLVDATVEGTCKSYSGSQQSWTQRATTVLGLGATHQPAGTRVVTKKHDESVDDPDAAKPVTTVSTDQDLTLTWTGDAAFTLAGKTTGMDKGEAAAALGSHSLVFP